MGMVLGMGMCIAMEADAVGVGLRLGPKGEVGGRGAFEPEWAGESRRWGKFRWIVAGRGEGFGADVVREGGVEGGEWGWGVFEGAGCVVRGTVSWWRGGWVEWAVLCCL